MPTNTLTDAECRRATAAEKARKLFDGGGLHLFISPKGAKSWRVAYRLSGKPQTMSLGPYPAVSLAEARKKRDALKDTLRDGGDPMAPRRETRKGLTFEEAARTFMAGRKDWSDDYRTNATRAMEMHLFPLLGRRQIGAIEREDMLQALSVMDAKGLHEYVRKTRMWAGQVFDWAIEHGHAKTNPPRLIKPDKAFGSKKKEPFAAVEVHEVPALLDRLGIEKPTLTSVLACRFLALTWVRTKEMRFMTWGELDGDLWRIPKERMKRNLEHLVPLSRQAQEVIAKMRARRTTSDFVWPAEHRDDRTVSENIVLALLSRIGFKGEMTGHGWRSVASSWANERGFNADAIERQLAHVEANEVRAAYNRAKFLPERRAMLQAWADWLDDVDPSRTKR